MIKRIKVDSSAIDEIGYQNKVCEVKFRDGSVHQYSGVAPADYHKVITAASVGKEFNNQIKFRYDSKRVS